VKKVLLCAFDAFCNLEDGKEPFRSMEGFEIKPNADYKSAMIETWKQYHPFGIFNSFGYIFFYNNDMPSAFFSIRSDAMIIAN
jgi:hypothetical protein